MTLAWKLEVAPEGSVFEDPDDMTWVDVTDRLIPDVFPKADLGRDPDIAGTPQPSQASWLLDSQDGHFRPGNADSPYYPMLDEPGMPIRWTCLDADGVERHLFYGMVDQVDPIYRAGQPDWTVVTVTGLGAWTAIVRMGARLTLPDRVGTDLAGPKSLDAMVNNMLWVEPDPPGGALNPVQLWPSGIVYNSQTWPKVTEKTPYGMGWVRLDDTGRLSWDEPGAGCVVAQTGGLGDWTGQRNTGTLRGTLAPWAGDRPGGQYLLYDDGVRLGVDGARCQSSWQAMVGRPPVQLDAGSTDSLTGWTASTGTLALVDLSGASWMPHVLSLDPATGATTSVLDPALSGSGVQWSVTIGGPWNLDSPPYAVTAGVYYQPVLLTTDNLSSVSVRWYDSGGTFLSSSALTSAATNATVHRTLWQAASGGKVIGAVVAPPGATSARIRYTRPTYLGDPTLIAVSGFHAAPDTGSIDSGTVWSAASRYWPVGAHLHQYLWLQWRTSDDTAVVCATIDVTDWAVGEYHHFAFNRDLDPGPVVWIDGQRATGVVWTQTAVTARAVSDNYSTVVGGLGFTGGDPTPITTDSAALTVPAVLLGADPPAGGHPLDDDLVARAWTEHGAPETLGSHTTSTTTADVIGYALDQANWPRSMRDIPASTAALPATLGAQWVNNGDLSDYASFLGEVAQIELGWLDVDQAGVFRALPRHWYDPDGDGTATAQFHWTWRTAVTGTHQYVPDPPPQPVWPFRDVPNRLRVTNGTDVDDRLRVDLASQRRGVRAKTITARWASAEMDDVADLLQALYSPGPRIDSITLRAYGPDDPMLTEILSRRTGDVGIVDLPQEPADDLVLPVLITSISYTPFGYDGLEATFGLSRCPIPAVDPAVESLWPGEDLWPGLDLYPLGA